MFHVLHCDYSLDQVWLYDWNEQEWDTSLSPMPLARHGHACGPWFNDGVGTVELVVVGGVGAEDNTTVYNFEQDAWRDGSPYDEDQLR